MGTVRRLLAGAAWIYGAQIASVVLQLGYAAFTSRLADASNFGEYSIALTATALLTLLATGGLSQTIARMPTLGRREIGGAVTYALLLGGASCAATILLARPLGVLWGAPGSSSVISLLAINALSAPIFSLIVGIMRRTGVFRTLALITLSGNALGMGVGAAAVFEWRSAESLAVSAIVSQTVILLVCAIATRSHLSLRRVDWSSDSIRFTWRVTASAIVQYLTGNVVKLAAARALGPATLGQWNRAEVLGSMPFQQLQTAMTQVLYPEFRHDRASNRRARGLWADLLGTVAWLTWPLGAVAAVLLPALVPILFGPGWALAALFCIPLALAGGLQPVVMLLYAATEATGRFRWIWISNGIQLVSQLVIAVAVLWYREPLLAGCALLASNVVSHGVLVAANIRADYLDGRALAFHYAGTAAFSAVLALAVGGIYYGLTNDAPWIVVSLGASLVLAAGVAAWRWRDLPPVRLARRWGFGRGVAGT